MRIGGIAKDQIRQLIDRIEKLEEEKLIISEDLKEVYDTAKAQGYDTNILKKVIKLRKMDEQKRVEEQEMLQLYMKALGMMLDESEHNDESQSQTQSAAA